MLTVRPATPADADPTVRIHVRSWQHAYAGIVPADVLVALDDRVEERVRQTRQSWESGEPSPYRTAVATDAGEVVGFTRYGPYRLDSRCDRTDPGNGEVLLIYVEPTRLGGGIGRRLMDHAVAALRASGATEVRLWVLEENAPARRFYERYGFDADGERHIFEVKRPGGDRVPLPEVRYAMPLA